MQDGRHSADEHESHLFLRQRGEHPFRVEVATSHRQPQRPRVARAGRSAPPESHLPAAPRGFDAACARTSSPCPGRAPRARPRTSSPAARTRRSTISVEGTRAPDSIRPTVDLGDTRPLRQLRLGETSAASSLPDDTRYLHPRTIANWLPHRATRRLGSIRDTRGIQVSRVPTLAFPGTYSRRVGLSSPVRPAKVFDSAWVFGPVSCRDANIALRASASTRFAPGRLSTPGRAATLGADGAAGKTACTRAVTAKQPERDAAHPFRAAISFQHA